MPNAVPAGSSTHLLKRNTRIYLDRLERERFYSDTRRQRQMNNFVYYPDAPADADWPEDFALDTSTGEDDLGDAIDEVEYE